MTREELEKQGVLLPKEEVERFSKGYASRRPFPHTMNEYKEALAEAYLAGTELMADFYLEHR